MDGVSHVPGALPCLCPLPGSCLYSLPLLIPLVSFLLLPPGTCSSQAPVASQVPVPSKANVSCQTPAPSYAYVPSQANVPSQQ